MNFLIVFDPSTGRSSTITPFPDDALADAMHERLHAELDALERGEQREIVVLNARNLDELRETHARYFGDDALRADVTRLLGESPAA